ncbi:zinc finger and SCAN domain-containing protein 2-like isoform X3 [Eriocheir sinensis]|uniref:zinc finger and SCAN domain-containing protein 2-like isoform X3 n=1 Tax=Eriocheir sinensis TaxID=95602 RepID=UPI0021C5E52B|nr:zinc finger and SCAN domain-containing protein 2-like isoform X3 [Eriocheir sinensis]
MMKMEGLPLDVSPLGDEGAQMITLVETSALEEDGTQPPNVHILTAHQLERETEQLQHHEEREQPHPMSHQLQIELTEQPRVQRDPPQSSPHCLVCNAKLGVSARGAMEVFSEKAKTSHRQLQVHIILSTIVNQDVSAVVAHSSIVCKKCFKLIDDIDSLEGQLINMKQVVTNKYMRTLALVKQDSAVPEGVDNVLEEDTLNLEASSLTKDDKDFKVYMGSEGPLRKTIPAATGLMHSHASQSGGGAGKVKRARRGRSRGRPPSVKLEVKQEDAVEVITGLAASESVESLKHQGLLGSSDSNDGLSGRLESNLEEDGGTDMLMVEEEMLEDSVVVETVEDVMEVDGLDLEDTGGCVQISGLTLPSLGGHELDGVEQEEPGGGLHADHHLLEEGAEKYKCRFCSLKTSVLADIQTHMREMHPERLYECEVCKERLTTKADLVCHLEQHIASGEKPYICTMCPRKYALPRQLKEHIRHHMNKTFGCTHCTKRFRSEAALQEHFNVHTGNRPYACDQCCKKFTSKHILKTHMKTHGVRQRPHQCTTCGKNFLTSHHLTDHLNVHEGKKNYICENCGKAFATQRSLDLHAITHSGVKNFPCSICHKLFARKGEVEDHERTHTGEKPFQCEICGSTFSQRSNLQSHKRTTHYQEKRYQCNQCHKAFKRKRLLVYHVMSVHTGERPYKCDQCNAGFVYPEHYKKHLRIHTGEKPFKCDICGKTFNSRDNRNAHKFIHSDKKPYECMLCGAGFMRKPMLASHLQQHGHTENLEKYIKVNPPTVVAVEGGRGDGETSPGATVRTMKLDEDQSLETSLDGPVQLVRGGVREGETVEVVSRPVHIIDADDLPRYIIHATPSGERTEEGMGHFFASLQGQVVEVRAEDLERYTDLTPDQMTQVAQVAAQVVTGQPATSGIQQVSVSSDLRPFNIQLEPATREVTLQTQAGTTREVSASIGVATATVTTRDVTLPTISHVQGASGTTVLVGGRQVQYEAGGLGQGTLRKVLTDREDLRTISVHNMAQTDARQVRHWQQQPVTTPANNFIGD